MRACVRVPVHVRACVCVRQAGRQADMAWPELALGSRQCLHWGLLTLPACQRAFPLAALSFPEPDSRPRRDPL